MMCIFSVGALFEIIILTTFMFIKAHTIYNEKFMFQEFSLLVLLFTLENKPLWLYI